MRLRALAGLQLPRVRQARRVRVHASAQLHPSGRRVRPFELPHQRGVPVSLPAVP